MFPNRPVSSRVNNQSSILTTAAFPSGIPNSQLMIRSRVVEQGYTLQAPIVMKQQSKLLEPSINGLLRNDTKATISSSPAITSKAQNIEVVRPFSRRQQISINSGGCQRVSKSCSSPGPGCLKCIPRWVLIILGFLFLSAIIFSVVKLFSMYHYQCRRGFHLINNKCYGCPEGSYWDGQNCIKEVHVLNTKQEYDPHSYNSFNTEYSNQNKDNVNQNNSQRVFSNVHHLRFRI